MAAGTIWTELNLDDQKFRIGLQKGAATGKESAKKIESDFQQMTDKLTQYMNTFGNTLTTAFSLNSLKNFTTGALKHFGDSEESVRRLNLALASTGKYTTAASSNFQRLTEEIADETRATKLQIRAVEDYLLQFTNLKGKMAEDAVKATIGLSAALPNESPDLLVRAVGKGMMGNMKALQRMGIYNQTTGDAFKDQKELLDMILPLYERAKADTEGLNANYAELGKQWEKLDVIIGQSIANWTNANGVLKNLSNTIWGIGWAIQQMSVDPREKIRSEIAGIEKEIKKFDEKPDTGFFGKLFGKDQEWNPGYKASRLEELNYQLLELKNRQLDLNKPEFTPTDTTKIFNPHMKDNGEAEKAKTRAQHIADMMATLQAKTLEETPGLDKHLEAIAKINNEYDAFMRKLTEVGANGSQLQLGAAAADHLKQLKLQKLELERQRDLYKEMLSASDKRAETETEFLQKLVDAGKSSEQIQQALDYINKFNNATEQGYARDKVIGDAGKGGFWEQAMGVMGGPFSDLGSIIKANNGKSGGSPASDMVSSLFGSATNIPNLLKQSSEIKKNLGGTADEKLLGKFGIVATGLEGLESSYSAGGKIKGNKMLSTISGGISGALSGAIAGYGMATAAATAATTAATTAAAAATTAAGTAAASAGTGAAAGTTVGPGVGTAIGAVVGLVIGGIMGFMGGGGSSKMPSEAKMESNKLYTEQQQLQYEGFMAPIVSKQFIKANLEAMNDYTNRLKTLDNQIANTFSEGMKAALDSPTTQSAIENFDKSFGKNFAGIFINEASTSLDKMMKQIMAPITQVLNDATFLVEAKFSEAMKPLEKNITNIYKKIGGVVTGAFDYLNKALAIITKIMPGVGNSLAIGIYGAMLGMIPVLYDVFAELLAGIGRLLEKIFEGPIAVLSDLVNKFEILFNIQPDWIKEMKQAGIVMENAMGSDAVKKMEAMWSSLKSIISSSLSAGFESGTASTGYENFVRGFKDGLYKLIVESISNALAAGIILLAGVAPYLKDIIKLIVQSAVTGAIDPKELTRILTGITGNISSTLAASQGTFNDIFVLLRNFKNQLTGVTDPNADTGTAGPAATVEIAKTGWAAVFEKLKIAWDKFGELVNNMLTFTGNLLYSIQFAFSKLMDKILYTLELIFGWDFTPGGDDPKWFPMLTGMLEGIAHFILLILGWRDKDGDGKLDPPKWFTWLTGAIDWAFTRILQVLGWRDKDGDGKLDPPKWFTWLTGAIDAAFGWIGKLWKYISTSVKEFSQAMVVGLENITGIDWSGNGVIGTYASGTNYVPRTGPYLLHQGEAVVTAENNKGGRGNIIINMGGVVIRENMDIDRISKEIAWKISTQLAGGLQ